MHIADRQLLLAATDLSNHLACTHLTALDRALALGQIPAPPLQHDRLDSLAARGREHESAYLDHLRAAGRSVHVVPQAPLDEQVARTLELLRSRADVIAQGALRLGDWVGRLDVLLRSTFRACWAIIPTRLPTPN